MTLYALKSVYKYKKIVKTMSNIINIVKMVWYLNYIYIYIEYLKNTKYNLIIVNCSKILPSVNIFVKTVIHNNKYCQIQ